MKALLLAAKKVAGRKLKGCECRGTGLRLISGGDAPRYDPFDPCPTCARLREIISWHYTTPFDCSCGNVFVDGNEALAHYQDNKQVPLDYYNAEGIKSFNVQSVRALLTDLGELDNFLDYLWHDECPECNPDNPWYRKFAKKCMTDKDTIAKATTFLGTLRVKGENDGA